MAQKALTLGASDYVEKPNVKELTKCVEELVSKLDTITSCEDSFERFEIKSADHGEDNFNCIISGYAKDLGRVEELIHEIGKSAHYFFVPANSLEKSQIEQKLKTIPNKIGTSAKWSDDTGCTKVNFGRPVFAVLEFNSP